MLNEEKKRMAKWKIKKETLIVWITPFLLKTPVKFQKMPFQPSTLMPKFGFCFGTSNVACIFYVSWQCGVDFFVIELAGSFADFILK